MGATADNLLQLTQVAKTLGHAMELYQLKTFVNVADEGNLTRAAARLFTSQPAISAHIKALEQELGVELFERSSRGMRLTAKGQLLYAQAAATLAAADQLRHQAQQLQQELVGEIRVGVHTDFEFMRIGELHGSLQTRYPRISPHFLGGMSAQILPDIRRGMLDAGFFFGPCSQAGLSIATLAEVPMSVVGPADWSDRVADASLAELAQQPWIYTSDTCPFFALSQSLFDSTGAAPKRVAYVDSEDAVRELVRAGAGLSLLRFDDAERLAADGQVCRWHGETPSITLGFAVHSQRTGEPVIGALRGLIIEQWGLTTTTAASIEA